MICPTCEKKFETKQYNKKYCCYRCQREAHNLMIRKEGIWKLTEKQQKIRKKLLAIKK